MTHVNWLHLSDLRMGVKGSKLLDADNREEFERDLRKLHAVAGPWDAVIFTGDLTRSLTRSGTAEEFAVVDSFVAPLLSTLRALGSSPVVLAVPDNRNRMEWQSPEPHEDDTEPFRSWYERWAPTTASTLTLEGDLSVGLRGVGVLGLASSIGGREHWADSEGRIGVSTDFVDTTLRMAPDAGAPWLLFTHHPPTWLREDNRRALFAALRGRAVLHLCGGARIGGPIELDPGYGLFQGLSLFGSSTAGRTFGYCAGRVNLDEQRFRLWPRVFSRLEDGRFVAGPDRASCFLDSDESFSRPFYPARPEVTPPPPAPPAFVQTPSVPAPAPPAPGVTLRRSLGAGMAPAVWVSWSPDGSRLASGHEDGSVVVWDVTSGLLVWTAREHETAVVDVAWSPDGSSIASISNDCLLVWPAGGGPFTQVRDPVVQGGYALAWQPGAHRLAFRALDDDANVWEPETGVKLAGWGPTLALAWSTNGARVALASTHDKAIEIWTAHARRRVRRFEGKLTLPLEMAWMPGRAVLAVAYWDGSVTLWDVDRPGPGEVAVLAGHSDAVTSVSFSADGRLLATKSHDGTVKLWRTDTWDALASFDEATSRQLYGGLAFSPNGSALATLGGWNIRLWDVDAAALLASAAPRRTVHSTSAKVVLVGEGSAGKSCLALRLAEDRYEEVAATHGMRFWAVPAGRLAAAAASEGEEREVVLWDLGGQSEYQLVHQLFLDDTTVAILVFEPRRGQAALDEIEAWSKRLEKLGGGHPIRKILVGAKLDDERVPVDREAIDRLAAAIGATAYVGTSARERRGIDALDEAIAAAIDWSALGKTSQPELFRDVRREIEAQRAAHRVVLPLGELEQILRDRHPEGYDPEAVRAVVRKLALQGVLADSRLADGTRALVLQVEQIERYAGSLLVMARDNPRGVAAIDLSALLSPATTLPRLPAAERLRRDQELVVVDCVVELLLGHGLALRHEGLLVFPCLFRPAPRDAAFSPAVALQYEFSGAVDNVYASLVTALAMSRQFGPIRLWEDRAELSRPGQGTTGVRKAQRELSGGPGVARLDVYFQGECSDGLRELFLGCVDDHLREHGVEIVERLAMTCACGFEFPEAAVRARMGRGFADIVCLICNTVYPLTFGAAAAHARSPDLASRLRALKTVARDETRQTVTEVKVTMGQIQRAQAAAGAELPIRILHLSDLHVRADADPAALLQPLAADLADRVDGLGVDRLDFLVVSGDVSNRADPRELGKARELCSAIIDRFALTAERCILVPGNHDLDWNETVYRTVKARAVSPASLVPGTFKQQGDLYEIRDDATYPNRWQSFSRDFYHPLVQEAYPLTADRQGLPFLFPEARLQFLAFNSCWEIDEYFPSRSAIHLGALSRALTEADDQIDRARGAGRLPEGARVLRLAVWHHPITGNEKMPDDAFMARLQRAGVRLCLHGHVHEDRVDLVGYLHPTRRLHVMGAGSFGAPGSDRPESVPRLYNLVELSRDLGRVRVHTRCLKKAGGAWEGWAVWPGDAPGQKRTYYEVLLGE